MRQPRMTPLPVLKRIMKSNTNGLLTDSTCSDTFGHVFSFMLHSLLWLAFFLFFLAIVVQAEPDTARSGFKFAGRCFGISQCEITEHPTRTGSPFKIARDGCYLATEIAFWNMTAMSGRKFRSPVVFSFERWRWIKPVRSGSAELIVWAG